MSHLGVTLKKLDKYTATTTGLRLHKKKTNELEVMGNYLNVRS